MRNELLLSILSAMSIIFYKLKDRNIISFKLDIKLNYFILILLNKMSFMNSSKQLNTAA